jgi:hypothetical protein
VQKSPFCASERLASVHAVISPVQLPPLAVPLLPLLPLDVFPLLEPPELEPPELELHPIVTNAKARQIRPKVFMFHPEKEKLDFRCADSMQSLSVLGESSLLARVRVTRKKHAWCLLAVG